MICKSCNTLTFVKVNNNNLYQECLQCQTNEIITEINLFEFNKDGKKEIKNDYKNIIEYGCNRIIKKDCILCNEKKQTHSIYMEDIDIHLICNKCLNINKF